MEKPNKKSEKGDSPGNHIRYLLKGIWNSDKRLMLLMLLEMACTVITPYVAMYLPKIGVDLVTSHLGAGSPYRGADCLTRAG